MNCIKEIFSLHDKKGFEADSEAILQISRKYEELMLELSESPIADDAYSCSQKLGHALIQVFQSIQNNEAPNLKSIGVKAVELLTAVNEANKKSQALDTVSRDIIAITRDLETTILFASAGTLNTNDKGSFSGKCHSIIALTETLCPKIFN